MQGIKLSLQCERPSHWSYLQLQPNTLLHHLYLKQNGDAHSRQGSTPFRGLCSGQKDQYWRNGLRWTLCNVEGFLSIEGLWTAQFTELLSEFCLSAFTCIHPLQINVVFSFLTNVLTTAYPALSWFPASSSWSVITINSPSISFCYHTTTTSLLSCSGGMNA